MAEMDVQEFRNLWLNVWKFSGSGKPEDATLYLGQVLEAVKIHDEYIERIGGLDGQQEFMFNWLLSVGLVEGEGAPRSMSLSPLGDRVRKAVDDGIYLDAFS